MASAKREGDVTPQPAVKKRGLLDDSDEDSPGNAEEDANLCQDLFGESSEDEQEADAADDIDDSGSSSQEEKKPSHRVASPPAVVSARRKMSVKENKLKKDKKAKHKSKKRDRGDKVRSSHHRSDVRAVAASMLVFAAGPGGAPPVQCDVCEKVPDKDTGSNRYLPARFASCYLFLSFPIV